MSRYRQIDPRTILTPDQFSIGEGASVSFPAPQNWMKSKAYGLSKLIPKQKAILEAGFRKGIEDARRLGVKLDSLVIDVYGRWPRKKPDDILGIQIAGPYQIMIAVETSKIESKFYDDHLSRLITHECNHIDRVDNHKIPVNTIEDALVSEGLALRSEIEAGHPPADFNRPASAQVFADYIRDVLPHLKESKKDHYVRWFFGPDEEKPDPAFGGYPLGLAIVNGHMKTTGDTLQQATKTKTATIIEHWQQELTTQGIDAWAQQSYDAIYPAPKAGLKAKAALPRPKPP